LTAIDEVGLETNFHQPDLFSALPASETIKLKLSSNSATAGSHGAIMRSNI
jgi:hypothetical protein